jgi:hypothetical protein
MSESGYKELDLDTLSKSPANLDDIEIVMDGQTEAETPVSVVSSEQAAVANEPEAIDDDSDDDGAQTESGSPDRKKLTRSRRLKAQRDAYAKQLGDVQARLEEAEARAKRYENDANEGAAIGFDLYIQNLDAGIKTLRAEFDAAFESGDRSRLFEVQQQLASLAATKAQAEKDRRGIPTKTAPQSGPAAPQQTQQTQSSAPEQTGPRRPQPPGLTEWYDRNKEWFNRDAVMTAAAKVIDQQMVGEGYLPSDPDYFDVLDQRLKREFPQKLGGRPAAAAQAPARQPANPTIQNRSTPAATTGKIRVVLTEADRQMARQLGITVEQYAREKAKTEKAQSTANQYTEIL